MGNQYWRVAVKRYKVRYAMDVFVILGRFIDRALMIHTTLRDYSTSLATRGSPESVSRQDGPGSVCWKTSRRPDGRVYAASCLPARSKTPRRKNMSTMPMAMTVVVPAESESAILAAGAAAGEGSH